MKQFEDTLNSAPSDLKASPKLPTANLLSILSLSKTNQYGAGKVLLISVDLAILLQQWREIVRTGGYILRSIKRYGLIENSLNSASISIIFKALQSNRDIASKQQPLRSYSFKVGAALDLLEQGETIEKIIIRGGLQSDSTIMKYLKNWSY